MKRWNKSNCRFMKMMMSVMICSSLMISMPGGAKITHATERLGTSTTVSDSTDTSNVDANGVLGKNSDVGINVTKSITGKAGKKLKVAFTLNSNDINNIKLKCVYPVIDTDFPFETSGDAYTVLSADNEEKQKSMNVEFSLTPRSDLTTGYHSVRFIGEYSKTTTDSNGVTSTADYYVIKTINIYFTGTAVSDGNSNSSTSTSGNSGSSSSSSSDDDDDDDDDDDYTPSRSSYTSSSSSDDDSDAEPTAPKLLITGYETKPEKVMAGESFELTIHLQNTSKTTSVCNGKFLIGNEAGNFTPTAGSSAVFVDKIEPEKTGDLKIEFKTSADLAQKNYSLVVKGDFDDGKGNTYTSSDSLSLPVYQEVKLGITDVSMSPESIGIGQEGSLMFTINNQGNAGVNNVTVSVDDPAVTAEQSYVGNIAGSSSAYATLNVTGAADNTDTGVIKVVISYEDSEGTAGKLEQNVSCTVGEDFVYDEEYEEYDDEFEEEETYIPWWVWVIIGVVVVAVITAVVIILVKRKKKKEAELFDDDEDEFGEDDIENEDF